MVFQKVDSNFDPDLDEILAYECMEYGETK
jgi:hypothetical protein